MDENKLKNIGIIAETLGKLTKEQLSYFRGVLDGMKYTVEQSSIK